MAGPDGKKTFIEKANIVEKGTSLNIETLTVILA